VPDPSFAELERAFTAHLRDPAACPPPPGVAPARLAVYRELVLANVERAMAAAFPVVRRVLPEARWRALLDDFLAHHRAHALHPRMPAEFLRYLAGCPADPPFLQELADYEWLEAEALLDPQELMAIAAPGDADPLEGHAVPNPTLRPRAYRYPVHRIGPAFTPQAPPAETTYLVVLRRRDDRAAFVQLNAVSGRLLELILTRGHEPLGALLATIAAELGRDPPDGVMEAGRAMIGTFMEQQILLGVRYG
jgi:hypothetical protein